MAAKRKVWVVEYRVTDGRWIPYFASVYWDVARREARDLRKQVFGRCSRLKPYEPAERKGIHR